MSLFIASTVEELIKIAADDFMRKVNASVKENGDCTVALSGGNSPKPLYKLLASHPYRSEISWDEISFFFVDERCVPFSDPANNGAMVKETLFDPLKIADSKIFYISTLQHPEEAAKKYSRRIMNHFKDKPVQFDVTLLGLGSDAHTASLFPHTPVLREKKALVSAVKPEKESVARITLTAPLINESRSISFLVYGENKAEALKQVLEGKGDSENYPAQLIQPEDGTVDWFLDEPAARLLTKR